MSRVFYFSSFLTAGYFATLSFSFAPTYNYYNGALNTFFSSSSSKIGLQQPSNYGRSTVLFSGAYNSDKPHNNDDKTEDNESIDIPCLPSIGQSSFTGDTTKSKKSGTMRLDGASHAVGNVGSEKFELQYTCKVCETRNSHKVSRLAYRHGVVITVCKGCMNKHLIADNLGWMQYVGGFDGNSNIEDFMNDIGRGDEVNRVSQEVFELEKLVHSSAEDAGGLSSLDETNNGNSFE